MINYLGAALVVVGTCILSKEVFKASLQRLVNLNFRDLPLLIKIIIKIFFYQKEYENKELWRVDPYPLDTKLTFEQIRKIISPFVGFSLVCLGTILWSLKNGVKTPEIITTDRIIGFALGVVATLLIAWLKEKLGLGK